MKKKLYTLVILLIVWTMIQPCSAFADFRAFDDIVANNITYYDMGKYTPSMYDSYRKGASTFYAEYFAAKGRNDKSLFNLWADVAEALVGKAHSDQGSFGEIYDGIDRARDAGVVPVGYITGSGQANSILEAATTARREIEVYANVQNNPAMSHATPVKDDGISDEAKSVVYYYKGNRYTSGQPLDNYFTSDGSYVIIFSDMCVAQVFSDDYLSNHVVNRGDYKLQTDSTSSSFAQEFINESDTPVTSTATLETTVSETVTVTESSGTQKSSTHNVGGSATLRIGNDSSFFGGSVTASYGYSWGQVIVQSKETAKADTMTTSASASMSVGLPPCTRAIMLEETGNGSINSTPDLPMMVSYNVTIVYFYGSQYVQYHGGKQSAVVRYCGDADRASDDARTDLYQRVAVGAADPYGFNNSQLVFEEQAIYFQVPVALANTYLQYKVTYTRNRMGDIQPLYNLSRIRLKDKAVRLRLNTDEPLDVSTLEVEGLNLYDLPYYGFDPEDANKGGWFVCDMEGNHLEGNADAYIKLEKNPVTGKMMLTALQGGGKYVLRYEVGEKAYVNVEVPQETDPVYIDPKTVNNQAAVEVYTVSDDAVPPEGGGVTGILLDCEARTMSVGDQAKLLASPLPTGKTDTYRYQSSNPGVAVVGDDGTITAKQTGETTVTVTSNSNPGLFARCVVTVVNPPSALKLSPNDLLLPAGGTGWLTASVSPAGTPAAISFTSSDETVAAVSDIGLVTAVSCGTAVIRAETGNGCYDLCYVKVVPPASGIDAPDELLLGVGETFALGEETALRRNALSEITYRSMDPEIVTVDASGFVIAVQRGETAIVIQGVGNVLKTVPVTVKPAPDRISISPAATTVSAADQFTVTAELPEGSVGTYRFSSSDERVARVSEDGLVTALGRGTAAITVTAYNGVSASCLIENLGVTEQSNALRLPASAMTVEPDAFAETQARIVFVPDGAEVQKDAFAGCGQLLIVVTGGATRFADGAFDHEVLIVDSLE